MGPFNIFVRPHLSTCRVYDVKDTSPNTLVMVGVSVSSCDGKQGFCAAFNLSLSTYMGSSQGRVPFWYP